MPSCRNVRVAFATSKELRSSRITSSVMLRVCGYGKELNRDPRLMVSRSEDLGDVEEEPAGHVRVQQGEGGVYFPV